MLPCYQGMGFLYLKKPPVRPLSPSMAKCTISLAASSGVTRAMCPPISVLTQLGHTAFTLMLLSLSYCAMIKVRALSAALEILYAATFPPISLIAPYPDETFTILPYPFFPH